MAIKFDQPFYSISDEAEQNRILEMWQAEKYGGLWEGNNRLPLPLVYLMALIILTAFMITQPIWGQRPTAHDFVEHVALMDTPEIQAIADPAAKMAKIDEIAYQRADGRVKASLERHPITWDDLLNLAPHIKEAQASGKHPMDYYSVLGDRIVLANFEGNILADGTRERKQPWWDKGYTIDVFYVTYFIIFAFFVTKRLPHFSRKPDMSNAK
ncbi:MAG: hypothetical protein L3J79_08890 [Candidatus Marinimicrobia bacterium]|nr:hypothetical protein [Candidatus Neomarinimicrobiota bacterium]